MIDGMSTPIPAPPITVTFPGRFIEPGDLRVLYCVKLIDDSGQVVSEFLEDGRISNPLLRGDEAGVRQTLDNHFTTQIEWPWQVMARDYAKQRADQNNVERPVDPDFFDAPQPEAKPVGWNRRILPNGFHPECDSLTRLLDVHAQVPWKPWTIDPAPEDRLLPGELPAPVRG
jgi:hypothetical protein